MTICLGQYLTVAAILFALGIFGIFLNRKNVIVILMAIELILLAVNINLVAFSAYLGDLTGQVLAIGKEAKRMVGKTPGHIVATRPVVDGVVSAARSDPSSGSLNSWHQPFWPVTMSRTWVSICSRAPWAAMVGAANSRPRPPGAPRAPKSAMTWATWTASARERPRP